MPYIPKSQRPQYNAVLALLMGNQKSFECIGELNYLITKICNIYLKKKGISYTSLNEVIGVLECVKLELTRRKVVPYEKEKMETNGDVEDE